MSLHLVDAPAVLTIPDAAARVGVCTRTVRRWIHSKQLPAYIAKSGRYMIKVSDLESMYTAT